MACILVVVRPTAASSSETTHEFEALAEAAQQAGARVLSGFGCVALEFPLAEARAMFQLCANHVAHHPSTAIGVSCGEVARRSLPMANSASPPSDVTAITCGEAVDHALALAHRAKPSELLASPALAPLLPQSQVPSAFKTRSVVLSGAKCKAIVINPLIYQTHAPPKLESTAPFVSRAELSELLVLSGTLGVVRAARGVGGTRFMHELEGVLEGGVFLTVRPHASGAPLAALTEALERGNPAQHLSALGSQAQATLLSLLRGEVVDLSASAGLLIDWLTPQQHNAPSGAILIDDAGEVDIDSLTAIARAAELARVPFRVVVRLSPSDTLPACLRRIPPGPDVNLRPLSVEQSTELAAAWLQRGEHPQALRPWAVKCDGDLVALQLALREAVEEGELNSGALGLWGNPSQSSYRSADVVLRRFLHCSADQRLTLKMLAAFGGRAQRPVLERALLRGVTQSPDIDELIASLVDTGWLLSEPEDCVAFPNLTQRDAVLLRLSHEEERKLRVRAAAALLEAGSGQQVVAAAIQAVLAGELEYAQSLCVRAAQILQAAGLTESAEAFLRYAKTGENAQLHTRGVMPITRDDEPQAHSVAHFSVSKAAPSQVSQHDSRDDLPALFTNAMATVPPAPDHASTQGARRSIIPSDIEELLEADLFSVPPPEH